MKMKRSIGIDLGTTHSAVAHWHIIGRPEIIKNNLNGETTPSVVGLDRRGNVIVGQVAKDRAFVDPDNTISGIKRKMGEMTPIFFNEQEMLPHEIASFIYKALKEDAERFFGESVGMAVITVPAYFKAPQVKATKKAAELAGLQIAAVVMEPTAATLAYGMRTDDDHVNWMVYDLGGGTFGVSIIGVTRGSLRVKGGAGNHWLGGEDFDLLLVGYMQERLLEEYNLQLDPGKKAHSSALQKFKSEAERAKIRLSSSPVTDIFVQYPCSDRHDDPVMVDLEITRRQFENLIRDKVLHSTTLCHEAVLRAELGPHGLDEIVLVGEDTHIPLVRRMLWVAFGIQPRTELNPTTCVAKGAAIMARSLEISDHYQYLRIMAPDRSGRRVSDPPGASFPIY